jgi:hypothetical protein
MNTKLESKQINNSQALTFKRLMRRESQTEKDTEYVQLYFVLRTRKPDGKVNKG